MADVGLLPLQKWSAKEKLGKNTPDTPHVSCCRIFRCPEEQLRRLVPKSNGLWRQSRLWRSIHSSQTKICQLHGPIFEEEHVIPVEFFCWQMNTQDNKKLESASKCLLCRTLIPHPPQNTQSCKSNPTHGLRSLCSIHLSWQNSMARNKLKRCCFVSARLIDMARLFSM